MKIKYFRNQQKQRMDKREKWASGCCPPKGKVTSHLPTLGIHETSSGNESYHSYLGSIYER